MLILCLLFSTQAPPCRGLALGTTEVSPITRPCFDKPVIDQALTLCPALRARPRVFLAAFGQFLKSRTKKQLDEMRTFDVFWQNLTSGRNYRE